MSLTIIRARRRRQFVILDHQAVTDTRLSWAARGLLCYLLSLPDDWKVYVNDLRKRGDLGRDGILKLLKELREAGYVHFRRTRDKQGRIRGGVYYVYECPTPQPDLPDTVEPYPAEPYPARPGALPKTHRKLKRTTTTIPTTTNNSGIEKPCLQLAFPSWVPDELQVPAKKQVEILEKPLAQVVIDEWSGILATDAIHSSPLGYLHTLVTRMQAGEFTPRYADQVATIRDAEDI